MDRCSFDVIAYILHNKEHRRIIINAMETHPPSGTAAMISHQPRYRITAADVALAKQFKEKPLGPHSPDLLRLLNRLRWQPLDHKYVFVCTRRHAEWTIGQVSADRDKPIELLHEHVFTSRTEAEWTVFKLRWKRATSLPLDID